MNDSMKLIYSRMMIAAGPMFEKLSTDEQIKVVERVANDLMRKIHGRQASLNDKHIVVE